MSVTVVDTSAVAAVLFDEPEAQPLLAAVTGSLIAPTLLRYELASVCTTKLARWPDDASATLERFRMFAELDIELVEPDWQALPLLATEWSLSAYDAAYLQLALVHRARLVTLDARLAEAFDKASGIGA